MTGDSIDPNTFEVPKELAMTDPDIDQRIKDAKQLVLESEALLRRTIGSRAVNQSTLDKLRLNLERLERLKEEVVTFPTA